MAHADILESRAFIYVIGAPEKPLKVGHSTQPLERLRSLRGCSTDDLQLLHARECRGAEKLFAERYAHALLWAKRVRGEWFDCSLEDAVGAVDRAVVATKAGMLPPGPDLRSRPGGPAVRQVANSGLADILGSAATSDQLAGAARYREVFRRAAHQARIARNGTPDYDRQPLAALAYIHKEVEKLSCKAAVTMLIQTVGHDVPFSDLPGSKRQCRTMKNAVRDLLPHILRLTGRVQQDMGHSYAARSACAAA